MRCLNSADIGVESRHFVWHSLPANIAQDRSYVTFHWLLKLVSRMKLLSATPSDVMLAQHRKQFIRPALAHMICGLCVFLCATVSAQETTFPSETPPASPETGFWFVHTHHSSQSFDYSGPKFCPAVLRHEQCQHFRQSDFQEMIASLAPGIPVCIMVHGSFVDTASCCRESTYTWKWLKSAGRGHQMQLINFHWPVIEI